MRLTKWLVEEFPITFSGTPSRVTVLVLSAPPSDYSQALTFETIQGLECGLELLVERLSWLVRNDDASESGSNRIMLGGNLCRANALVGLQGKSSSTEARRIC
jgi:hypothetical protein